MGNCKAKQQVVQLILAQALTVLLTLTVPFVAAKEIPKETLLAEGSMSGQFNNFIWSDYPYIEIYKTGNKKSFLADKGAWSVLEEHSSKLKGLKINISRVKVKPKFRQYEYENRCNCWCTLVSASPRAIT